MKVKKRPPGVSRPIVRRIAGLTCYDANVPSTVATLNVAERAGPKAPRGSAATRRGDPWGIPPPVPRSQTRERHVTALPDQGRRVMVSEGPATVDP